MTSVEGMRLTSYQFLRVRSCVPMTCIGTSCQHLKTVNAAGVTSLKNSRGLPIKTEFPDINRTLMSKTLAKNNASLTAIIRDAYGNGLSGNTERSLRYIREALLLLEAQQEVIETKGDARKQMTFDKLNRAAAEQAGWPAFDGSKVQESLRQWADKGLTLKPLPAIPAEELEV